MALLAVVVLVLSLFPTWSVASVIEPAARALVDRAAYVSAVLGGGL